MIVFDGGDKNGQLGVFTGHNNNSYSAESQTVEYHLLGYIISKEWKTTGLTFRRFLPFMPPKNIPLLCTTATTFTGLWPKMIPTTVESVRQNSPTPLLSLNPLLSPICVHRWNRDKITKVTASPRCKYPLFNHRTSQSHQLWAIIMQASPKFYQWGRSRKYRRGRRVWKDHQAAIKEVSAFLAKGNKIYCWGEVKLINKSINWIWLNIFSTRATS